jgi:hypothetical protein
MSTNVSLEFIGKFIGPDEIVELVPTNVYTPKGTPIIEVTFKGGKKRRYTATALDYMLTDELSDYTTVSDKRLNKIASEVVSLVQEYDVTVGDIDRLMQKVAMGIEEKFNEATSYMWFRNPKEYTVGFNPMYDVSLNMAQEVIDQKPHDGEGNTTA